jgi:hypothetical protein
MKQRLVRHPSCLTEQISAQDCIIEAAVAIEGFGRDRKIVIQHFVRGKIDQIRWPTIIDSQCLSRRNELWKHTCFEAFIQPTHSRSYWEINLSPSGDWNVYRFDSYRQGMREELAIRDLISKISKDDQSWTSRLEIWIPEWDKSSSMELGLTCVIEDISGKLSYWAIHHAGAQPDFHLHESFTAKLAVSAL